MAKKKSGIKKTTQKQTTTKKQSEHRLNTKPILLVLLTFIILFAGMLIKFSADGTLNARYNEFLINSSVFSELGLAREGFEKATSGACKGQLKLKMPAQYKGHDLCTHGGDPRVGSVQENAAPPYNSDPIKDDRHLPAPLSKAARSLSDQEDALTSASQQNESSRCSTSTSGPRVTIIYAYPPSRPNSYPNNWRPQKQMRYFRQLALRTEAYVKVGGEQTNAKMGVRWARNKDCSIVVNKAELPANVLQGSFSEITFALFAKGFNRNDRKYMVYVDAPAPRRGGGITCGTGTLWFDDSNSVLNDNNVKPGFGVTYSDCWGGRTPAHELFHNLGAVQDSAPNSDVNQPGSESMHCTEKNDVMCYTYNAGATNCLNRPDYVLDCNKDDYFNANPRSGSYLDKHWNTAKSRFLINGGRI